MSQNIEKLKYICYCSKTVRIEQREFNAHMNACQQYEKKSKFYQEFKAEYIQTAKIADLLGMKTGLEILVDEMNQALENRDGKKRQEFFSDYYEEKQLQKEPFRCLCDQVIAHSQIKMKQHIKSCNSYLDCFPFHMIFMNMNENLAFYPVGNLEAFKCEFVYLIDKISQLISQKSAPKKIAVGMSSGIIGFALKCELYCRRDMQNDLSEIVEHELCNKAGCKNCFRQCIQRSMLQDIQNINCPFCNHTFSEKFLKRVLRADELQDLLDRQQEDLKRSFGIVKCVKCNWSGMVEEGRLDLLLRHPKTKQILSKEHAEHYRINRFKCDCQTEQCKNCRATPYHLGYTCEEFKNIKKPEGCRFCGDDLDENQINFCLKQECLEKTENACQKRLACGHFCFGVKNEKKCLPCLHSKCQQQVGLNGNEHCVICFDALNTAPVVVVGCGHPFHYHCIVQQLKQKWTGRILFNFCMCSHCKQWMVLDQCPQLQKCLNKYQKLQQRVIQMATEKLNKDPQQLSLMPREFKNRIWEYALDIFCYYQCFTCKEPYFGGKKDCLMAVDDEQKIDPNKLLCQKCLEVAECKEHGNEYIQYKCRFCCSIAQWFCWGTTHFCESCHRRQCNKDYINKYPIERLPKCPGKELCPLKLAHKPNGEEQALGCAICRSNQENKKKPIQQF